MSQDDSKQPDPYEPPAPRSDPYAHDPYQQGAGQPGGSTQPDPYRSGSQAPDPYAHDPYAQGQQGAAPQGQPSYAQPGYPPAPGYPGTDPQQPYGQYPPPSSGTDGFSIAALVTGILMMTIVPIVLGIIGLSRIKRTGQSGKGLAIAGIVLGAVSIVGWVLLIIFSFVLVSEMDRQGVFDNMNTYDSSVQQYGDDPRLDALYDDCSTGDSDACNDLYWDAPSGSEYEDFALAQR